MNQEKRDKFTKLWKQYFNNAELPITFQYSDDNHGVPVLETPHGHRCLISQLLKVRRGESMCLKENSVTCIGAKRYLMYTDSMPPKFECYISHYEDGRGERYKSRPDHESVFWENLQRFSSEKIILKIKLLR